MRSAIKIDIVIPSSRHVELKLPDTVPAGPAEIIVLTPPRPEKRRRRGGMGMDVGRGWAADDFDAQLPPELQRLFEGRS